MPSERQLLEGTIRSTHETVKFHEARGAVGEQAAAAAAKHRDDARAKLAALKKRAARPE